MPAKGKRAKGCGHGGARRGAGRPRGSGMAPELRTHSLTLTLTGAEWDYLSRFGGEDATPSQCLSELIGLASAFMPQGPGTSPVMRPEVMERKAAPVRTLYREK